MKKIAILGSTGSIGTQTLDVVRANEDLEVVGLSAGSNVEKLEEQTSSFPGGEKAYAIQAGREVRIMVKPEEVSEDNMIILARDIAKKIENELEYPGQIKVNLIRETKAVEYAK